MASLKAQALGFVSHVRDVIEKLPDDKESEWIDLEDAARAASVDIDGIKKLLRRPRIKKMLDELGIGCSFRTTAIYAFKQPDYGTTGVTTPNTDDLDDDDDDATTATPAAPSLALDVGYFYWPEPISADLDIAIDAGMNIFLVGPAGSGKSSLLKQICLRRGVKPIVVSFNGEVSVDDLVGTKDAVNGQTVFTEGVLPQAMRRGIPIIIDEADATPPDVQFVLHPVLMGEPLCLTRAGGEYVNPEPGFFVAATGNTVGRGDDSGLYVGTNVLNEAYLDRYGTVFEHWYMPKDEETIVLVKRTGVHKRIAEKMVKVAELARDAMRADTLSSTFSTRKMLDWAKLVSQGMDLTRAFIYSCINKVGPEDKRLIAEFGQRIFATQLQIDPSKYV
jgi:cobaltochelatase CobS